MKKRLVSLILAATTVCSALAFTGCGGGGGASAENSFSWWIYTTDGAGTYYENYEDNPAITWLNQQYWDTENHTLGTKDNGTNLQFSFEAPIKGAETDNFSTMMSTGEYTDVIDLRLSSDSAETLYNEGILLELTDYVEEYCPNYVELLDANPELKALVTTTDEDGKVHYYKMACIKDGNDVPWGGYVYRRDWVVKYATPSEYIWDWDSDYVKENGHPAVTPLAEAQSQGNLTGWKKNEVTTFTASEGDDPDNDYTDNVIFPSGKTDPYTVSDWEWMFEAFQKAIDERGYSDNSDAYCTSLFYYGYMQTGDLVSSFGGGNGSWCKDEDYNVSFSGTSDNFKTYLEAMHTWYDKGWIDTKFETRSSDSFYTINQNGYSQGMVGMWYGTVGLVGDTIRATCQNEEDKKDAYVMACACPVNDMYGTEDQKYLEPDCFYQGSRISGYIGITEKAADKNLEALFSYFNWSCTEEGKLLRNMGLNEEQIASVDFDEAYDVYGKNNIKSAYTLEEGEDGKTVIKLNYDATADIANAVKPMRMLGCVEMTGSGPNLDYTIDKGLAKVTQHAYDQWTIYTSTAGVMDYDDLLSEEDSKTLGKINTYVNDYMSQALPGLIKDGLGDWDTYVKKIDKYGPDKVTAIYQKTLDQLFK